MCSLRRTFDAVSFLFCPVGRNPFLLFCFFFALSPLAAVLSGRASLSPHNSILSYWNFGGAARRWRTRGVRAQGHERRLPVKKLCALYLGVGCSHPYLWMRDPDRQEPWWPACQTDKLSGMRAYSPAGRHFMHDGGWPCSPKRAMSFFPVLPLPFVFLTALLAPGFVSRKLEPGRWGVGSLSRASCKGFSSLACCANHGYAAYGPIGWGGWTGVAPPDWDLALGMWSAI